ncbi:hypothetical protein PAXRUDRAFT_825417 [Paxillus rubicundulus Ve08.2h10]|uniref:Bromo domain-containing protein n=1 Tax=Paxillus rubicundulus Ve08.2h10 TaxID=930991 RepID=A0A0D0DT99_9AGAM|nr:hypothetical protein PAXRUDRAFT_825417 [Paxillus rubicundulus Ve08.2h10]
MDDFDAGDNQASTSQIRSENRQINGHGHSGITLVLPSLKAIKAANVGKKSKLKNSGFQHETASEPKPKIPRPIKLKPLKEVLTKLVTQIKKKDDYAFFIHPVDPVRVPGYADVVKNPMDFGTMTVKVNKGKYRSLEDFTSDFRLVTTNAKIFNPPGSIYHAEADRLEAWGLDHIARASAHVIEFETDWNIDVEQDEDDADAPNQRHSVHIDDEVSTPRDMDGSIVTGSPAPSVTPAPGQVQGHGPVKRGPRGPYKKHAAMNLSEGLDAEGRMPGSKDGVGAFPPGGDWAQLMVALKIKGKRYRTKKERLRFEKEGPPYHPDGSLDYAEMEDPFSVLNVFVPDPPSRPQITPLYPPPPTSTPVAVPSSDTSQHQHHSQPLQPPAPPTIPITIPSNRPSPVLATLSNLPRPTNTPSTTSSASAHPVKKFRHWNVVRNPPARSRLKDKDADGPDDGDVQVGWKIPREPGPGDYGSFASLLATLAAPPPGAGTGTGTGTGVGSEMGYAHATEQGLFSTIRSSVENRGTKRTLEADSTGDGRSDAFWTDDKAVAAWDYIRDVVYGGVDGYAYVRSLAEFVSPPVYLSGDHGGDEDEELVYTPLKIPAMPLGVPLARYVEDNLVDAITGGRHSLLRDLIFPIRSDSPPYSHSEPTPTLRPSLFQTRVEALPVASCALASLDTFNAEPLDMAALIKTPEELARESSLEGDEWGGMGIGGMAEVLGEHSKGEAWGAIDRALAWGVGALEELERRVREQVRQSGDEEGRTGDAGKEEDVCAGHSVRVKSEGVSEARGGDIGPVEGKEEPRDDAMDVDPDLPPDDPNPDDTSNDTPDPVETEAEAGSQPTLATAEDTLTKRLRMNLLALAKRAPLDRIAKLPIELVPENIRGIVPTV